MWSSMLLSRVPRTTDTIQGSNDPSPSPQWVEWLRPDYWPDSDNISGPFRNPGTTDPEDSGLSGAEFMILYPGTYDFSCECSVIDKTVKLSLGIAGGSTVPTVDTTLDSETVSGTNTVTLTAENVTITDFTVIGVYVSGPAVAGYVSNATLTITRKA